MNNLVILDSDLEVNGDTLLNGGLTLLNKLTLGNDARTIADSGDANPAALTLNPAASYIEITCNDADGCDITMDEASPVEKGDLATITNLSANNLTFTHSAGELHLPAATATLGQYDSITLLYLGDRWITNGYSVNDGL